MRSPLGPGLLSLLLATTSLGQEAEAPEPAADPVTAEPEEEATSAAEPPPAPRPRRATVKADPSAAAPIAHAIFQDLLAGNARGAVQRSAVPFHLEARRIASQSDLLREWLSHLRSRRVDLLKLEGLEVLTPKEMEARHGKPPSRLGAFPWTGSDTLLAVGNLSGKAAVLVLKDFDGTWRAVAFHD